MRALDPQTRFLLRGSALLAGVLVLWWLVLVSPMLYLLKGAAGVFLSVGETSTGDWTFHVPLETAGSAASQRPVQQQLRSIDFDMSRSDAVTFTFSLPVFWALMLAAPGVKRNLRPLLWGTILMAVVEVMLLVTFVQITAIDGGSQMAGTEDASHRWMSHVGIYLVASVLPYVTPFILALSIQGELRKEVLSLSEKAGASAPRKGQRKRPALR